MKVWVKLLIGAALGVLIGMLAPQENAAFSSAVSWLATLATGIGRYAAAPMLVFSLTIAIYELRQDGRFWRLIFHTFVLITACSVFVIGTGIIAVTIFPPAVVPIFMMEQTATVTLGTAQNILDLFPSNMFGAIVNDGLYLLPLCVFAFFMGMGLSYDRNYTKPVISLIDSLSRIFYHIASFFSEILGFIMIALSAYWAYNFHVAVAAKHFRDILILLGVFGSLLALVIMPLFLYLLKPKCNPWMILYGSLGQAVAGFFSGDINFTLPVLLRHTKENLGCRRRSNTVTISLFTIFGRAGSAMTAAVAFILIIKSYNSLGISLADVLSIGLRALAVSFLLARHPGDAAYTALAVLCAGYGRSYEAGYLILKPIAFYIIAVGTLIDVMLASFGSYVMARLSGFKEDKEIRHFI